MSRINFGDIFSHVAMLDSIIWLLSITFAFDFEVEYMDVKTKNLHGALNEDIYMKKPKVFVVKGNK